MAEGRAFLERLPVSATDKDRIAHDNAEKLSQLQGAQPQRLMLDRI